MTKTQVFISFKMHDEWGELTKDYFMAKKLYEALRAEHIQAFFSDISLFPLYNFSLNKSIKPVPIRRKQTI